MRRLGPVFLLLLILFFFPWIVVFAASAVEDSSAAVDPPFFLRSWGAEGDLIRNPSALAIVNKLTDPNDPNSPTQSTLFVSNTSMNRITRITPDQVFFNWGKFGTASGQFVWPGGIAADAQENIYVADSSTPGRMQKFDRDGNYDKTWKENWEKWNLKQVQDVDVGPDGRVYVTETGGDRIRVFNSDGELIEMDDEPWGGSGETDGKFKSPYGIALDPAGEYVYVVDRDRAVVQKFDNTGKFKLAWGEKGEGAGQFKRPWRVAVDNMNRVYVTDVETQYVHIFDGEGNCLGRWGGPDMFFLPRGIEINRYQNDVFIADLYQVRRFPGAQFEDLNGCDEELEVNSDKYWGQDPTDLYHSAPGIYIGENDLVYTTDRGLSGEEVGLIPTEDIFGHVNVFNHVGVRVDEKWPGDDVAPSKRLKRPDGISGDIEGNIYVADAGTHRIVKFNLQGLQVREWGNLGSGLGEFDQPLDVTVSRALDLVLVADTCNHRVQKFDTTGEYINEWTTTVKPPGNCKGLNREVQGPSSVATDDEFVFVFDLTGMQVLKFDLEGNFKQGWGGPGSGNGEFGEIQKNNTSIHEAPRLAVYDDKWLLVTDPSNHRVQVFDKEGTYLTQWGNEGSGPNEFTREMDVAVAENNEIFVSDLGGHRIQVFSFDRPSTSGMVLNGSFDEDLSEWYYSRAQGRNLPSVQANPEGEDQNTLLLGGVVEPEEAAAINTMAWAHQTIFVDQTIEGPVLSFNYNIGANDNIFWADFLAVIEDASGINRLATIVKDGYSCGSASPNPGTQLGWREAKFDLSQFEDQTIRLVFYNRYLHADSLGIWTYVDDVKISSEPQWTTLFAPVVGGDGTFCDQ